MSDHAPHKRSILAVLAHPDDETFGMGGTLALYAQQGVEVNLVCATRGEAGDVDSAYMGEIRSKACLRVQELKCAAELLGIKEVVYLNYSDSGMPGAEDNHHPNALAAQPVITVAEKIAGIIRQKQPDIVLTFDPIGGYRHPDHIAVHQASVLAFDLAADPMQTLGEAALKPHQAYRLYFHTINRTFIKAAILTLRLTGKDPRQFGRNQDIDLVSIAEEKFPTHVRINYAPVAEIREKAAACHASQGGGEHSRGIRKLLSRLTDRKQETFMQAYPPIIGKKPVQNDFFAGF